MRIDILRIRTIAQRRKRSSGGEGDLAARPLDFRPMDLDSASLQAVEMVRRWEAGWSPVVAHPSVDVSAERAARVLDELGRRLGDNYPFFHPSYAGQMLKPPHPAAAAAYLMAMLINPNNHALDGGPATAALEREAVAAIAAMFHYPVDFLGHLTSSGTIANLEALFVARELRPGAAIAFGEESHYTHERMCRLLGVRGIRVPADDRGRMDLEALEQVLRTETVGTVVLTAGTTALGAVDPIDEALALRERYGVRLHVDAAYGGFHAILAWSGSAGIPAGPYRAIAECDSVVVDPHKHGLQPYGCGCVLFRDPAVGRFYVHEFPVHLLHLLRASPRRDQPGVLARGGRGGGAVDNPPAPPPHRLRAGRGPAGVPAGGRAPRSAAPGAGRPAPVPGAGAGHRGVPPLARGDDRRRC